MERVVIKVSSLESGERLDRFLVHKGVLPSRSQIQRLIEQHRVKVNGFASKPGYTVNEADHITIEIPAPEKSLLLAQDIPLTILHEDDDLIVIHKLAGQVVHPGAGNKDGTLVNALLFHCKHLSGIGGVLRPGVVHRLDKDTSGVMVFAKTDAAHQHLSKQFQDRTVKRRYLALIFGRMKEPSGIFSDPIGRHPVNRKKMSIQSKRGKPALTRWKIIQSFDQVSLAEAILSTGRTHQIRVHFSSSGNPVVGDTLYGGARRAGGIVNTELRRGIQKLPALLLHAQVLQFEHPISKEPLAFEVPLPDYFQEILNILNE